MGTLFGPWQRFDTLHYIHIAKKGYQIEEAIFSIRPPLYPLLIRWLSKLLVGDERYLIASLIISNVAALGYLFVFAQLTRETLDRDKRRRALLYAITYPWAFFLLTGYAESLFLLLTGLTFWAIWRRHWWLAGICGALAALTRVQGAILTFPILFEALRQHKFRLRPALLDAIWALLPGLAAVGFLVWRHTLGFPPVSQVWATHFHDKMAWPWTSLSYALRMMLFDNPHITDILDFIAAITFLILTIIAWRELPLAYSLYMTAIWWLSLSHVRAPHPLASTGRYMLEMFPAFFLLSRIGDRTSWLNRLILYPSVSLLLFLSANFFLWGWSG
jgi:hypothetical protein